MDKLEAQSLVEKEIVDSQDKYDPTPCTVMIEETIEKDWGWVFFYQSKEFLESGEFSSMLAGNAPIIINRNTGKLTYTGTANSIEYYIKEYESTLY